MNIKDISLKWKTAVPIIVMIAAMVLITVVVTGYKTRQIVLEEVEKSTLNGYRDSVLNSLTTLMVVGNFKESKKPFMEQMKHVVDLRVIRSEALDKEYGKGDAGDYPANDIEKEVVEKGIEKIVLEGNSIRGVFPYTARANFMGKNCLSCHKVKEGDILGAVSIKISLADSFGRIRSLQHLYVLLGLLGILSVTAIVALIVHVTHSPLILLAGKLRETAETYTDLDISFAGQDEIGELARNVNKVIQHFNRMINDTMLSTSRILPIVDILKASVEKTSEGSKNQSGRAARIATAAEEMSQTITDIAKSASEASEMSGNAKDVAEGGKEIADNAIETVSRVHASTTELAAMIGKLDSRVGEIGDIVTVIKDIADQTNLLALNAAIEAARAGEQGRGFAVVADEVRKLAERTVRATTEITERISTVQAESEQTTKSMEEASGEVAKANEYIGKVGDVLLSMVKAVEKVRDQITRIATAVDEQSATSEEVARNIEETSKNAKDLEKMSDGVLKEVVKLTGIADELRAITAGVKTKGSAIVMLELAKTDHRGFVGKIAACLNGTLSLTASQLPDHHSCRFGKWYDKEGKVICGAMPSYSRVVAPHEKIHLLAKEAVEAHNAGNSEKAKRIYNEIESISRQIVGVLDEIRKECGEGE
ncbi:MAG: methyl-accepting chemotaxis protein [Nitrospirae bacterium]|nr:methyl-accepting chemotaxis protein [Nitrospirota bacterium]